MTFAQTRTLLRLPMRFRRPAAVVAAAAPVLLVSSLLFAYSDPGSGRELTILRIQQLIGNRQLVEARIQLTEAAKRFPADAGFDNLAGIVEAQQGNYTAAEKNFNQAIKRAPKLTAAYLNLGRLYQENVAADPQAQRKALRVYGMVLDYDPNNLEANYQSAVVLLQRREYQDSLNRLSRLPPDRRGTAQAIALLCADYAGLDNRKEADDAAARLILHPEFSELDAQQMLLRLETGKRYDLITSLLESLQNRQTLSPGTSHTLGLAYERTNRLVEARSALEKSAAAGNLSVASLLDLARVAYRQQDYRGSLGYLAHARDLDPGNAQIHYSFGIVCVDLNLIAEARNSFEKAVNLEPENPSYNYAMGAASAFRHDPAEAVPYFEKYLKLKPHDPRGKLALGAALFRAKDYGAAVPWLREAAQVPETATTAHYYLGAIALEEGLLDEAFIELQEALKARSDFTDALAELGQYYLKRRDYAQAEKQIQL